MSKKDKLINGSVVPINEITSTDIKEMHQLFIQYYDNAGYDTFKNDLSQKDAVFMIRKKDTNEIVGFSTVVKKKIDGLKKGRNCYAVFSGDTLVDKEFWGTTSLHFTAIRYIVMEKLKNPTSAIFWFLITKGYKTYLIMANNLNNCYPAYDNENDPKMEKVLKKLCMNFFPKNYDEKSGLLLFGDGYMKLKGNVAEITEEMKEKYPKIRFYEKVNPTWRMGTELPCTVELSFANLSNAIVRQIYKVSRMLLFGKKKTGSQVQRVPALQKVKSAAPSSTAFRSIPLSGSSGVSFQKLKDV